MASEYTRKTGAYMGFLRAAQSLGIALGPLVVFIFSYYTYDVFVIIASLLCLMPISVVFLEEPRKEMKKYPKEDCI